MTPCRVVYVLKTFPKISETFVCSELAELCLTARNETPEKSVCFLGGGEPVVQLATTDKPRRGGRNQEVALAAVGDCGVDAGIEVNSNL